MMHKVRLADHSLESYQSRRAQAGEEYVIPRIQSGSVGLARRGTSSIAEGQAGLAERPSVAGLCVYLQLFWRYEDEEARW